VDPNALHEGPAALRSCHRAPIPEIELARNYLDQAASAHLAGRRDEAGDLIRRADIPTIRQWTESIWGENSPHVHYRAVPDSPRYLSKRERAGFRMPTPAERSAVLLRDGYHCRFCGIPVIRKEVRDRIRRLYPEVPIWGGRNLDQHAAFQAMWLQYDHLLPHSRGGSNALENILITCAPCNYGRMDYTLEEVGLIDPRLREPTRSNWDGLERFR